LPEQGAIRENHGYSSQTPAADADGVYTFFGKSGVHAFDHAGNHLWQADVGSKVNGWGTGTSVVLVDNLVIVNASVESSSVVALDKKTGKEVWRFRGLNESWNTPVLVKNPTGKMELVVAGMPKVFGLDPKNGQMLWSCLTNIPWYIVPSGVSADGVVYYLGGRPGDALAIRTGGKGDVTSSHRLWKTSKGATVTSPIFYQNYLYWMNDLGVAYCVEAKNGNLVYQERVPGADQVYASPIFANGNIYYLTRTGKTFVVAARPKFELLATNLLGERSLFNSSPAVADGKIIIRSEASLYCIGQ
jgi:hypothetical protein